jgi:hypothetical protein
MSLAPGEQRTLSEIERQLCRSDPELAAMFEFASYRLPQPWCASQRSRQPGWSLPSVRMIILIALGAALLVACLAIALVAASHAIPQWSGRIPGAALGGSYSALL